jgi:MoxR-like ATPase
MERVDAISASGRSGEANFIFGQPVTELYRDPAGYDPGAELSSAIYVALLLGLPLLLTGEPGCGKTSVAHWLAWKLSLGEPLVYNVKSASTGRDLLYEFDELARFRDASAGDKRDSPTYLRLNALGLAILLSALPNKKLGRDDLNYCDLAQPSGAMPAQLSNDASEFSRRHVVLIDELDKAPRDTPNDLLAEIDQMRFHIQELGTWIEGEATLRPIVVITSNSEKSLPEPFLRRCVFHHIRSPDDARRREIVERRQHPFAERTHLYDQAMRFFDRLSTLSRTPGTAELLAWLTALEDAVKRQESKDNTKPLRSLKGIIKPILGILAKTRDDVDLAEKELITTDLQ